MQTLYIHQKLSLFMDDLVIIEPPLPMIAPQTTPLHFGALLAFPFSPYGLGFPFITWIILDSPIYHKAFIILDRIHVT